MSAIEPQQAKSVVRIDSSLLNAIRRGVEEAYPYEGCGLLLGRIKNGEKEVQKIVNLENRRPDSRRNRYLIPPDVMADQQRAAGRKGLEILGVFHSHPDVSAQPSTYDREHAWPWYSYVIVSVCKGRSREVLSWRLKEDRSGFFKEELEVVASGR